MFKLASSICFSCCSDIGMCWARGCVAHKPGTDDAAFDPTAICRRLKRQNRSSLRACTYCTRAIIRTWNYRTSRKWSYRWHAILKRTRVIERLLVILQSTTSLVNWVNLLNLFIKKKRGLLILLLCYVKRF